jgi:predicted PurR-regulated permease PerM
VATFVGVASALALWAIGLRYWLVVGVVAGVTNLIPFLGPIVGGALAVTIALASGDPMQAVWAALVILVVQQVESHLVAPLVLSGALRLLPLVILVAVLLGAFTAGVPGMLLGVPVAGSVRVLVHHFGPAADTSRVAADSVASDGQVRTAAEPQR